LPILDTTRWIGASGLQYPYGIHPIDTTWTDLPGNYIFAREATPGRWARLYIGETQSFRYRLTSRTNLPIALPMPQH
jgi:hypothetical protein